MPTLSLRAQRMPASPIRRLVPLAEEAERRGVHVLRLNIGQPDIPTPRGMIEAYQSYDEEVLAYGPAQGLPALQEEVARYYTEYGDPVRPEHVTVTFGGSEALVFALAAITDPGDEVVVFEPFYANYLGFGALASATIRSVVCSPEDGFRLPPDEAIEAAINPRTKAFVFCSPGNPTGVVLTAEEMQRIGRLAEKHDLFIISDETYKEFSYDGEPVTSALSLDCADERVIVADSVSKRFSACGARVGFLVAANPDFNAAVLRMALARLCPATVDQLACVAAYQLPSSYLDPIVDEYRNRRDVLVAGLNAIDGVSTHKPHGAFYTMATFPVRDIDHYASWLLTDFSYNGDTVMLAPGTGFYATPGCGQQEGRIAYVLGVPALKRALAVFEASLKVYPQRL